MKVNPWQIALALGLTAFLICLLFKLVSLSTKPQSDKLYKDEPPKYELEQFDNGTNIQTDSNGLVE